VALPDDLLQLARHLANLDEPNPRQAALRRAVSTAYYALFHLLVSEATLNWGRIELRPLLGRVFEHGNMKTASERIVSVFKAQMKKGPAPSQELAVSQRLHVVASTFIQAQQRRNEADYDTSEDWTREEVLEQIDGVSAAFSNWNAIRDEPVAQAYLVSLLGRRRV
jgi:uncharacterized protein (UPF0332 family)